SLQSIISPGNDTLCSGETPLLVQVKNQGRIDKLDDLIISYSLTGPDNSSEDLTFAGGLMVGVTDTFDLGSLSLNTPGEYELLVFMVHSISILIVFISGCQLHPALSIRLFFS